MKKQQVLFAAGIVSALSLSWGSSVAEAASDYLPVNVQVDNQLVEFPDAKPFLDNNQRTQVPVRFVSERLGYRVDWKAEGKEIRVTIRKQGQEIVIRTGEKRALVNGKSVSLDTKAFLHEDRTYVPIRFVAESLGSEVKWDHNSGTAIILTGAVPESSVRSVLKSRAGFSAANSMSVVPITMKYVGVPYRWGGTTPDGFDCSGFVKYVFAQKGIELPRTSREMYTKGSQVSQLQPGDLVFFTTYAPGASHVGIYVGNNQFISATSSGGVRVDSMGNSYWASRYVGARRI